MSLKNIVPKSNYLLEIDLPHICTSKDLGFVRRSLKSNEDTFDEINEVRFDALCLNLKDIPGLSINILGSHFTLYHLQFNPKNKAAKPWDGLNVDIKKFKDYINIINNPIPIYFLSSDLIQENIPFQMVHNASAKALLKKTEEKSKYQLPNGEIKFSLFTNIQHKPTFMNYWHAEFNIFNEIDKQKLTRNSVDELTLDVNNSKVSNNIAFTIFRQILVAAARKNISSSDYSKMRSTYFKKKDIC